MSRHGSTIRLGLMPPLTGIVALYGQELCIAADVAAKEINAQGGILGMPLEIIIEDDGSLPETAVPAAERLIDAHGCVAIIGNLLSNSRISVANRVATPRRIPYLNFSFYEGSISSRYFFHFAALPNQQIERMIPYMVANYGHKIFFAGNNYEWPRGSIDACKHSLSKIGGEVVGEEYFNLGTSDFSPLLNRVAKSGADIFVPYAAGTDQLELLSQFTHRGLKDRMSVVMGHYDENMVSHLAPEVRDGFYSSNTYFMSVANEHNTEFLDRLLQHPSVTALHPQGNGVLSNFGEGVVLCIRAFAAAANKVQSIHPEDLVEALSTISINSPQGAVHMDPATHHAHVNSYLAQCRPDGRFDLIENFGVISPVIPQRYRSLHYAVQSGPSTPAMHPIQLMPTSLIAIIDYHTGTSAQTNDIAISTAAGVDLESLSSIIKFIKSNTTELESARVSKAPLPLAIPALPPAFHGKQIYILPLLQGTRCTHFSIHAVNTTPQRQPPLTNLLHAGNRHDLAMAMLSAGNVLSFVSPTFASLFGYTDTEDMESLGFDHLWSNPEAINQIQKSIKQGEHWSGILLARLADGSEQELSCRIEHARTSKGRGLGYFTIIAEPTDKPHTEPWTTIMHAADVAIIAADINGNIININDCASNLFGYSVTEMLGLSIHQLVQPHLRKQHEIYFSQFIQSDTQRILMSERNDISGYRKDGTLFPIAATITKAPSTNGMLLVVTLNDISDRKAVEDDLIWRATHDGLTGLPNRSLIRDRLSNALLRTERSGFSVAVIFIDLDNFKLINDSYGHDVGDVLLSTLSERLTQSARPGDTVGRFGGDEFVIICDQITDHAIVQSLATRIISNCKQSVKINNLELYVTVSIGATLGDSNDDADTLLRNADAAMYHAKDNGRDNWMLYDEHIGAHSFRTLEISNALRHAIDRNELSLVFQPIVCLKNHQIIGAEALLRWDSPDGPVSPAQFIPIAESNGSIISIGYWVFENACQILHQWQESIPHFYLSINLSARQLNDKQLATKISAILSRTGADPRRIVLELTETSLIQDIELTQQTIHALSALGFRIAVDDFGTGYSSLSQLLALSIDVLKIDRAFVDGLEHHGDNHTITDTIIKMAHALDLRVIAEGVENETQLQALVGMGCDTVQGYYFYPPLSLAALEESLFCKTSHIDAQSA